MSYELTGKLAEKFDTIQRTESFRIREFVVEKTEEVNGRTFTNYIKFQCTQDKTSIIDKVNVGEDVKVYFNIKGSKSDKFEKTSYFTNLDAWRIEQLVPSITKSVTDTEYIEPLDTFTDNANEDLPF